MGHIALFPKQVSVQENAMAKNPRPKPRAIPLAHEVYRRMVELELTQKELAQAAGLGPGYVADLFAGKSQNPKTEQLAKLANVLGCEIRDLTHPQAPGEEPQGSNFMQAQSVLPLSSSEIALVHVWRALPDVGHDLLMSYATNLLPPAIRKRKINS